MNHCGTQQLKTPRLTLRKFCDQDVLPSFQNWCNDPRVTTYLTWQPHFSVAVTNQVFSDWIRRYSDPAFYQWAIVLDSINQCIGTISVVHCNEEINAVTIGYCIGSQWWHQGITSEAFAAVIDFLFQQVKVNRIESRHDVNNPNSGKVMQKCGLTYEGTLRQSDWNNQGVVDACYYGILSKDYFAKKTV